MAANRRQPRGSGRPPELSTVRGAVAVRWHGPKEGQLSRLARLAVLLFVEGRKHTPWLAIGRLATSDVWHSLAAVLPPVFCESRAVARFFRTVRVIANVSNGRFTPGGWLGSSLQVVEGSSGYFALGYLLYVAERSYTR